MECDLAPTLDVQARLDSVLTRACLASILGELVAPMITIPRLCIAGSRCGFSGGSIRVVVAAHVPDHC